MNSRLLLKDFGGITSVAVGSFILQKTLTENLPEDAEL